MSKVGNGALSQVGVSILGIGMITGMHAAISPSVFTFRCFARKPEEKAIARKTLFISLAATTATSLGLLLVFKEWIPAIISEVTALGLFGLGMHAVECAEEAPAQPSMSPGGPVPPLPEVAGLDRIWRTRSQRSLLPSGAPYEESAETRDWMGNHYAS